MQWGRCPLHAPLADLNKVTEYIAVLLGWLSGMGGGEKMRLILRTAALICTIFRHCVKGLHLHSALSILHCYEPPVQIKMTVCRDEGVSGYAASSYSIYII